jgi:hypothetical protein
MSVLCGMLSHASGIACDFTHKERTLLTLRNNPDLIRQNYLSKNKASPGPSY